MYLLMAYFDFILIEAICVSENLGYGVKLKADDVFICLIYKFKYLHLNDTQSLMSLKKQNLEQTEFREQKFQISHSWAMLRTSVATSHWSWIASGHLAPHSV